jgi:hypothetical protein
MSKILRRPMFRGGKVDSRGTGITSGLIDKPKRGLVDEPGGYAGELRTGGDILKNVDRNFDLFYQDPNMDQLRAFQSLGMGNPFRDKFDLMGRLTRPAKNSIFDKVVAAAPIVQEQEKFEEDVDTNRQILDNKKFFSGDVDEVIKQSKTTDTDTDTDIDIDKITGTGGNTEEPVVDAQSMIKENAELFRELFAESNKEKLKEARIADASDIGLSIFAKSQKPGATVGTMLADTAEEIVNKPSRVEKQKELIAKQGDTSVALAINDYIAGKRSDESIKRLIAGKDLDLARAIKLADYKDKKNSFIDNLKENTKGMNFSTALITSVQETFKKVPTVLTEKDVKKGVKVEAVEENVGEYFVYPSGKVTTIQDVGDGTYQEVVVYTRGG